MYAIVEINGQQFKVTQNQEIFVHKLAGNTGDSVIFDKVLLIDNNGSVQVGAPVVEGVKVAATIVDQVKGDKVIIFKKKRRKGYKLKNGFRQSFTKIKIEGIA
ncbi:MAG: 50S ribosomal protein L21 [Chitinophagales bacterium]|nr:50S ribosomal protein L21 [Chitinophagales bacterium]MCZ2392607.1 50S ribosomal protein L21 [Chitinophagales bacterium]